MIAATPVSTISAASMMNVYGRCSATLTIHMVQCPNGSGWQQYPLAGHPRCRKILIALSDESRRQHYRTSNGALAEGPGRRAQDENNARPRSTGWAAASAPYS
jgi:hypothetical protein